MKKLLAASVLPLLSLSLAAQATEIDETSFKKRYVELKAGSVTGFPSEYTGDKLVIGISGGTYLNENVAIDADINYWSNKNYIADEDLLAVSFSALLSTDIKSESSMTVTPFVKIGLSYLAFDGMYCGYGCVSVTDNEISPSGAVGIRAQSAQGIYVSLSYTRYFSDMINMDVGTAMIGLGIRY